jgi:hypothetical protein
VQNLAPDSKGGTKIEVFENGVLRRIFGSKKDEVRRRKKLQIKELLNFSHCEA